MAKRTKRAGDRVMGMDLGDKHSVIAVLEGGALKGSVRKVPTTRAGLRRFFRRWRACPVFLEVGTHSPWVSRLLAELGFEPVIANARRVRVITENWKKSDATDAELLARLGAADRLLLQPIVHRGEETQAARVLLRARDALVRTRANLINHVRGVVKTLGFRLPGCGTPTFARTARKHVPEILRVAVAPVLDVIQELSDRIRGYDDTIEEVCKRDFPETALLLPIKGVGPVTALAFVTALEDPQRFPKSRSVGAYLGLTPRSRASGSSAPELRISKAGDVYTRRLLVSSAQYLLGPRIKEDSALRQWGLTIVGRGGKNAKKRAAVAVARKLAVLMHRLWITGEAYEPFPSRKAG